MKKIVNKITINYEKEAENFIDEISEYLLTEAERINSFFNINPKNINITIIPTKDKLDNEYWNNPQIKPEEWIVGFTNYSKEKSDIYLLSYNDYKNTPHKFETIENYKKTLVHEYIHIINSQLCKGNFPPNFIWEGVATYLSKQYPKTEKIIETKENIINCNCDFNQLSSLFELLIKNYSHEEVIEILKNKINEEELLNNLLNINNKTI